MYGAHAHRWRADRVRARHQPRPGHHSRQRTARSATHPTTERPRPRPRSPTLPPRPNDGAAGKRSSTCGSPSSSTARCAGYAVCPVLPQPITSSRDRRAAQSTTCATSAPHTSDATSHEATAQHQDRPRSSRTACSSLVWPSPETHAQPCPYPPESLKKNPKTSGTKRP